MDLAGRIAAITDKIRTAERKRGSLENSTRLMAAVKERETSEIDAAVSAGIRFVGENKIQEGERHFSAMAPASLSSVRRCWAFSICSGSKNWIWFFPFRRAVNAAEKARR